MATYTHVEVIYLDSPPMLSSIDSRTPNKVNGYGDIASLRQRGYIITPLVPMTPALIAALDKVIGYHESMHAFVPETQLLRELLREATGGEGDADGK